MQLEAARHLVMQVRTASSSIYLCLGLVSYYYTLLSTSKLFGVLSLRCPTLRLRNERRLGLDLVDSLSSAARRHESHRGMTFFVFAETGT